MNRRRVIAILLIAIALPAAGFASKKKSAPPQDTTDWLNAPTPDGSPTLKETSDWLAKTLSYFAGRASTNLAYESVSIDNRCNLSYAQVPFTSQGKLDRKSAWQVFIPLGAVDNITLDSANEVQAGVNVTIHARTPAIKANGINRSEESIFFSTNGKRPDPNDASVWVDPGQQIAPRVKTAIEHAVALCQGTFNAPAQRKEPF